jgi:hypothetical protein
MGVSEVHKDRCGPIAIGSLSVIVKIPEWRRNPTDFPAPEGPFLSVCAPVDHSKETRSALLLSSLRSLARRRLVGITGRAIPGARWLRDQSRSHMIGLRS